MVLNFKSELAYVALLFGLFVVPRVLQRFRIPAAITSLGLGALAGPGLGLFQADGTIALLSTLGIVSLFLFAGLEVEVADLRREARVILEHIAIRVATLAACAVGLVYLLPLEGRAAVLVSLALLTPSTGFILDSLPSLGLSTETAFWVRTKAIATELVALGALFVTLQSASPQVFALSAGAIVVLVILLPLMFRAFARFVMPYAPKTEFAFLLMVSVVSAFATKKLGVYYLVGAFVVGMVAQRFRERLPAMASEKMLDAIEAFASFFVPFYFFHAGLVLHREDFSLGALLYGALFFAAAIPLRLALVALHRRLRLKENLKEGLRVGLPMSPTLVFTLVLAEILRERFGVATEVFGGLIVYALLNTLFPSFFFRAPPPEFETPEAPPLDEAPLDTPAGFGAPGRIP